MKLKISLMVILAVLGLLWIPRSEVPGVTRKPPAVPAVPLTREEAMARQLEHNAKGVPPEIAKGYLETAKQLRNGTAVARPATMEEVEEVRKNLLLPNAEVESVLKNMKISKLKTGK